jgi:hypothetical protein
MKTLLVFAAVVALVVIATISAQTTPAQATTCGNIGSACNAHAHLNTDRNGNDHHNAGNVENEGGRDGSHFNHQRTCNDNNGKCSEHTNFKDR